MSGWIVGLLALAMRPTTVSIAAGSGDGRCPEPMTSRDGAASPSTSAKANSTEALNTIVPHTGCFHSNRAASNTSIRVVSRTSSSPYERNVVFSAYSIGYSIRAPPLSFLNPLPPLIRFSSA